MQQQQQLGPVLYMTLCQNNSTRKSLLTVARERPKHLVSERNIGCQLTAVKACPGFSIEGDNTLGGKANSVTFDRQEYPDRCQQVAALLKCYRPTVLQVEANLQGDGADTFYLDECNDKQLTEYPKTTIFFTGTKMDESKQNALKNEFSTTNRNMYVVCHNKGDVPGYQHRTTLNNEIREILGQNPKVKFNQLSQPGSDQDNEPNNDT